MIITLAEPERLKITDADGNEYIGGTQEWYEGRWSRIAGCGPVVASNLLWYMTISGDDKLQYLDMMEEMFMYVAPTMRGVNKSPIFTKGIERYGKHNDLNIISHVLEIPEEQHERPDIETVRDFIVSALQADSPVAFLNLSSGSVSSLENWHWMTIIAIDTDSLHISYLNHCEVFEADISAWLDSTEKGGAMVWLSVSSPEHV